MITWYLHFQAAAAAAAAADGDLKNNSDQHEHAADGNGDLKNNSDQHEPDVSFELPTGLDIAPLIVFMEVNPNQI